MGANHAKWLKWTGIHANNLSTFSNLKHQWKYERNNSCISNLLGLCIGPPTVTTTNWNPIARLFWTTKMMCVRPSQVSPTASTMSRTTARIVHFLWDFQSSIPVTKRISATILWLSGSSANSRIWNVSLSSSGMFFFGNLATQSQMRWCAQSTSGSARSPNYRSWTCCSPRKRITRPRPWRILCLNWVSDTAASTSPPARRVCCSPQATDWIV